MDPVSPWIETSWVSYNTLNYEGCSRLNGFISTLLFQWIITSNWGHGRGKILAERFSYFLWGFLSRVSCNIGLAGMRPCFINFQ